MREGDGCTNSNLHGLSNTCCFYLVNKRRLKLSNAFRAINAQLWLGGICARQENI